MTIACEASARTMSLSVIPPTPLSRTRTGTSSFWSFSSSLVRASIEPWTSALMMRFHHLPCQLNSMSHHHHRVFCEKSRFGK